MAVTISVAELQAALRLGDRAEETAEVTRLLAYATEAVTQHAPDASETAMNEAVRRLSGHLFDQPEAARGDGYANALRYSGASRILLPYRVHRLGLSDAVSAAQAAVGTVGNPVTGLAVQGGHLVVTFEDGSTDELDLPAGQDAADQVARDAAAAAQSEIDTHEASEHNTDTTARSTARNARQVGKQAQTTIETHAASEHNHDATARTAARAAEAAAAAAAAAAGAGRVDLHKDTATYRRTSASTVFRQFDLSRAPARGRGLELVIASTNRRWTAPFYCGTTDDWLDTGALSATQLNGVISAGIVPVANTILLKSTALDESNSNSFGHGIVYVGRVNDTRIGVAFAQRRGIGERLRMTVREIP